MRKSLTTSLDIEVLDALKKRAEKHHLSTSRELEQVLRKVLRL